MAKREHTRNRWAALIARWRDSGMSMAAFCREHELSYFQFVRWRRRLERETSSSPLTLIPILRAAPVGGGAIVVRLPDGVAVEVAPGFDFAVVVAVMQALQGSAWC
jgi:transposase-like protein